MLTNIINQTLLYLLEKMKEEDFSHLSEEEKEIILNKARELRLNTKQ